MKYASLVPTADDSPKCEFLCVCVFMVDVIGNGIFLNEWKL